MTATVVITSAALIKKKMSIYSIWGGLPCGLLLGSCGWSVGSYWALVGSGDASLRIYSIWGGLRCGLLWVPATFLWEFTAFCVGTGHVKDLPEKNCRWEGAIANLAVKNIAGEKVPCQICRWKILHVRRSHRKSAGTKYCRWEGTIPILQVKNFAGEEVPSQICR